MNSNLKVILIVLVIIGFVIWAFSLPSVKLTPEQNRDSIAKCRQWGGEVIYDSDNTFSDCAINGRVIQ